MRPLARVVPLALVAIEALEVGHARRGEAACGHDAELRRVGVAFVGGDAVSYTHLTLPTSDLV